MKSKENIFFSGLKLCRKGVPALLLFASLSVQAQTAVFWDSVWSEKPAASREASNIPEFRISSYCVENELNQLLDSLAEVKRKARLIPGFRILLYSGNDREQASRAKENAYRVLPRADVYTQYQAPTFKVKVGDYFQKVEAFRDIKKLQSAFPYAVIVQEIVNVKN